MSCSKGCSRRRRTHDAAAGRLGKRASCRAVSAIDVAPWNPPGATARQAACFGRSTARDRLQSNVGTENAMTEPVDPTEDNRRASGWAHVIQRGVPVVILLAALVGAWIYWERDNGSPQAQPAAARGAPVGGA